MMAEHDRYADAVARERAHGVERHQALDAPCRTCGHGYGVHALNGCHRCGQDECTGFLGKPDWGHGPNAPIPIWTEAQIRVAMEEVMHTVADAVKIEAVLARLRLFHLGAS